MRSHTQRYTHIRTHVHTHTHTDIMSFISSIKGYLKSARWLESHSTTCVIAKTRCFLPQVAPCVCVCVLVNSTHPEITHPPLLLSPRHSSCTVGGDSLMLKDFSVSWLSDDQLKHHAEQRGAISLTPENHQLHLPVCLSSPRSCSFPNTVCKLAR